MVVNTCVSSTSSLALPSGITVVKICGDTGAAIEEASEENNCAERRIAIGSDLMQKT